MYKQKDSHARGVRANMRSQDKIDALNDRIHRASAQYRAARRALVVLGRALQKREWEITLKLLTDDDVRGMPRAIFSDPERQKGQKKKSPKWKKRSKDRELSWIWLVQGKQPEHGAAPAINEALRIEWAKARVRSLRWSEEVDLLEEEMRRIQQFVAWRAGWWKEQIGRRELFDGAQREGETAYALRQSAFQTALCDSFAVKRQDLPALIRNGRGRDRAEGVGGSEEGASAAGRAPGAVDDGSASEDQSSGEEDDPVPDSVKRPVKAIYVD
ncbi:hypothetical protein B0H10DRAFT_2232872 [Mycena sp. CBHHK59/15]|nr:hypothetical protein B0H10DRAFT_2232872 [Mycena sp. CBHHK59/15]